MSVNVATPWHKASYERFLDEWLPQLLAERLPLLSYSVVETGTTTCRVMVTLASNSDALEVPFDLPMPDDKGLFKIGDELKVVVPIATSQELDKAEIQCVGEQLHAYIAARLGQASADLPWDMALARAWLPIDTWINEFMAGVGAGVGQRRFIPAQRVDDANWLALHTHLRRLIIPEREDVIAPGQLGYVCPFETPEGPNIGHILTIATGAEIRDGRMAIVDDRPVSKLGLAVSMIPFLEHNDSNRVLMGANMLRQWVVQQMPEPALVQTGHEPDALLSPEFWNGRNLLTAFVSWGPGTYEDGIIVSESCARRFDTPYALQLGDKLSNRHGTKGVVGQILPDDEMPHLPDGTAVDLVYNFAAVHRRVNFGQVREAMMGRIAHATGESTIVPPFQAPSSDELRNRCRDAGLPESGMETLTMGQGGPPLELPSTVGWIYWGRLFHLAKDKLRTFVATEQRWGQRIGEMETFMLRDLGAFENVRESLSVRAVRHPEAATLRARVVAGAVGQAQPPTPMFMELTQRLSVAGIEAVLEEGRLLLRFAPPSDDNLKLALPVPHPWHPERSLTEIRVPFPQDGVASDRSWELVFRPGHVRAMAEKQFRSLTASLIEANERLSRMLAGQAPKKLVEDATVQLECRVRALFDVLLTPAHLRLGEFVSFSGRSVLVPGTGLSLEQLGLPDRMAWDVFEPLVVRELDGDREAVAARSKLAVQALDALMARSWVILNRAPTLEPTALLAFHPVRVSGDALHLHPLVCKWLNADFDGDQAAVFLPITETAQREAGDRLTVAAHLTRDPSLLSSLIPTLDMLWGLAWLSRKPGGLDEISQIVGEPVATPAGFVTKTALIEALDKVLARDDVRAAIGIVDRLMQRGFESAMASGASISPFLGASLHLPPQPSSDGADSQSVDAWSLHFELVAEVIAANTDYESPEFGPQLLMTKVREREIGQLSWLVAARGPLADLQGLGSIVRHGYVEGLTPEEMFVCVVGARRGLAWIFTEMVREGSTFRDRNVSRSFNVLTRALRAKHPGLVFARAAATEEVDPLTDVESRMLVGLPVRAEAR